jgi:hypothetical protein
MPRFKSSSKRFCYLRPRAKAMRRRSRHLCGALRYLSFRVEHVEVKFWRIRESVVLPVNPHLEPLTE